MQTKLLFETYRRFLAFYEALDVSAVLDDYYQPDDKKIQQGILSKYETMFNNPFVAIAFYDKNGNLIEQNEVLQNVGTSKISNRIQPLYNVDGEIANYFVTQRIKDIEST